MGPIKVFRSPFKEQTNGDLVCSITIKARDRGAFFAAPTALLECSMHVPMIEMITDLKREPAASDDFKVTFDLAADITECKPSTQTVAPAGDDQSSIMVPGMDDALRDWKHPARQFLPTLFMWQPFQQFAIERAGGGSFKAPMPTAVAEIRKAALSTPGNVIAGLELMLDTYRDWTMRKQMPAWPG